MAPVHNCNDRQFRKDTDLKSICTLLLFLIVDIIKKIIVLIILLIFKWFQCQFLRCIENINGSVGGFFYLTIRTP